MQVLLVWVAFLWNIQSNVILSYDKEASVHKIKTRFLQSANRHECLCFEGEKLF